MQSHLQRQHDARCSPQPALWEQLPQTDSCALSRSPRAFPCSPRAICCSPDCSPSRACDPGRSRDCTKSHRASLPVKIWCVSHCMLQNMKKKMMPLGIQSSFEVYHTVVVKQYVYKHLGQSRTGKHGILDRTCSDCQQPASRCLED